MRSRPAKLWLIALAGLTTACGASAASAQTLGPILATATTTEATPSGTLASTESPAAVRPAGVSPVTAPPLAGRRAATDFVTRFIALDNAARHDPARSVEFRHSFSAGCSFCLVDFTTATQLAGAHATLSGGDYHVSQVECDAASGSTYSVVFRLSRDASLTTYADGRIDRAPATPPRYVEASVAAASSGWVLVNSFEFP